ncbi:hypothetical protein CPC735_046320 [Coccidioides posadasii C735 delta SOWgp]|uniref:Protein kinase domain-containing protein n=1 Tax=Coccidioides posadasii (strain C735) TaxID=222929 RepID=C5PFD4_COCP7|nr:hypothetical protein CPC735_046320 [Coccidioides posadasii C735 delta SOWgp]EER23262.1 hypothetical protein CPC735_046320 [Coccidioides posadasii C735 delta SOWgp]|eukprot:XP_003065407.1 hypothetical protein CPC735_046320 [Coccidioides posadasii C735 delta SOWgp]
MRQISDHTDYKALFLKVEEERKRAEEVIKQAEKVSKQAEEEKKQQIQKRLTEETKHIQKTTFEEAKYPLPLENIVLYDCDPGKTAVRQQEIYVSVRRYLQPAGREAPRFCEKDIEHYERIAVEDHVHDIISALCKIPQAREEFGLGDGVQFENHGNSLDQVEDESEADPWRSQPAQFCIHRVDGNTKTLLTTVEYTPPHKLSLENLRSGLRPIDFYHEIVESNIIPTGGTEKLRYNATRLAGSAIVQEYHVMIQEGLEYSYLSTGLANVQLHVPFDDPATLYYDLGEPNLDVDADTWGSGGPKTEIERVLCLCLMSCVSQVRGQAWRNSARAQLPTWETNFSHIRSQIPANELRQKPPSPDYASTEPTSSEESPPEYVPSSPVESPVGQGRQVPTRSRFSCGPPSIRSGEDASDSDSDLAPPARRKRGFSLQQGGDLDSRCPNFELHRSGAHGHQHPISAQDLVLMLKRQLDQDLDQDCTPMGECGAYGPPFKVTCAAYGYTVVGKGTTSRLWKEVSQEAEIYHVLQRVQGSAVPVFLGKIDLAQIYFLHGAGQIRHMLLMGWGGESVVHTKQDKSIRSAISQSKREIRSLGVLHGDLRPENILWNTELKRALIIDFHRCTLSNQPKHRRSRPLKRQLCGREEQESKHIRFV